MIDEKVQVLRERATMLRYTYIAYLFELGDLHRLRSFSLIKSHQEALINPIPGSKTMGRSCLRTYSGDDFGIVAF